MPVNNIDGNISQVRTKSNWLKKMKEHPVMIVVTLAAMVVGAILGAPAFYQGWLG